MQLQWFTNWFMAHASLFWILGALSLVMFIGTIIALPLIIIYLPAPYFNPEKYSARPSLASMSAARLVFIVVKNVVGALLVLAGLVMLVLPGQGLVTLLIGLLLMNFPGKRRLICRLMQQPKVFNFINRIRTAAKRPPVVPPNPQCPGGID